MARVNTPVAARLQSARERSGHNGFSTHIQGSKFAGFAGAPARQPLGRPVAPVRGPLRSNQTDRLGYEGVVERCDSVDFTEFPAPHHDDQPSEDRPNARALDDDTPPSPERAWAALPRDPKPRAQSARTARPSSAVYRAQVEQRRGLGGFEAAQAHAHKHGGGEANRTPVHAIGASPRAPAFGDVAGRDLLSALEEEKRKNMALSSVLQQQKKQNALRDMQNKKLLEVNEKLQGALMTTYRVRPFSASSAQNKNMNEDNRWTSSPAERPLPGYPDRPPEGVGSNNGRSSAFGRESLENRAVYSPLPPPTGPIAPVVGGDPQSPPKDELWPAAPVSPNRAQVVSPGRPVQVWPGSQSHQQDNIRPGSGRPGSSRPAPGMSFAVSPYQDNLRPGSGNPARPRWPTGSPRHRAIVQGANSRPQSANAAMRGRAGGGVEGGIFGFAAAVAAGAGGGGARPESARPASARNGRPVGGWVPPNEEGKMEAIKLLTSIRSAASTKYIRLVDFMRTYDKFKTGYVTFTEFRRGMDACGCFANVTENEFSTMQQLFKEASPARPCSARGPYAHTVMRVCYGLFCEVVQPSGEATAPMTDALAELVGRMPPVDVKPSRGR